MGWKPVPPATKINKYIWTYTSIINNKYQSVQRKLNSIYGPQLSSSISQSLTFSEFLWRIRNHVSENFPIKTVRKMVPFRFRISITKNVTSEWRSGNWKRYSVALISSADVAMRCKLFSFLLIYLKNIEKISILFKKRRDAEKRIFGTDAKKIGGGGGGGGGGDCQWANL